MSKPFNYGGQAVIEGVMMRGRKHMAVAVRNPQGEIVLHSEPLNPRIYSSFINKVPFLRGFTLLWDALVLGMRTLMFSAEVAMGEEEAQFTGPMAWGTVAFSLLLAVAIFFVSPLLLISLIKQFVDVSILVQHLIEGLVRLALFLAYVWGIGFLAEIKRVFGYHGAEHKAINAYEQGVELTPEKVAQCSIVHPRCGTAFLLIVMVISIFVFALVGDPPLWLKIVSRIVLIPVIAGIAYEFLKFSAAHQENPLMKLLIAPGLALQGLTTREPDLSMLEVSIAALKKLLTEEQLAAEVPRVEATETLTAPGSAGR
ncbi:MAG: membrane protein [Chloroflexota bacterium]|nr:MAG: membrane protein [Chloroflexota bacterium]